MSFYDEMRGIATDLLTEFKQGTISYIKIVPGNGPVDDPGPSTPIEYVLSGATATGVTRKYVDLGLAVASDLQVVAAVDPRFEPDMKGSMKIDGSTYKILGIFKKPAAGTPVAITYVVRRGPG